jgi:hypothetical protein
MARTVEITVSSEKTDALVAEIGKMQGLLGLHVQRGVCR